MPTLTRELRRILESTVKTARRVAEDGARKSLEHLAVQNPKSWESLTSDQRALRRRLRAHAKQLGDLRDEQDKQEIGRLTAECAYEHWHRMLFARFLAELALLVEPETGMAVTLDECRELARERGVDWLELASSFATRMLPQIFRLGDPLLEVDLPPETRAELEKALEALPQDIFLADDSLGWVYQFWQAERKEEVNRSGKKIGAEELPAVTQLFTEDYMVLFLLHNTLGAWWAGKVLAAQPDLAATARDEAELRAACKVGDIDWTYLRFVRENDRPWRPAAGTFDGWPRTAREITLLDPCMGSGHFLVFAFFILIALRMTEEGLTESEAVDAVLCDNLYGLEIDPRCTQIAAFNLALAAWRKTSYRPLPRLHLACSGLSIGVSKAEWLKMAERAASAAPVPPEQDLFGTKDNLFSARIKEGFSRLYDLFEQAPVLGSLIAPQRMTGDLEAADFLQLEPLLAPVLASAKTDEMAEMAVAAQGMMKAAEVLRQRFTLVLTNVPYLGRGKQDEKLQKFCELAHSEARADLATCFIERCLGFCDGGAGSAALVTPQNWLFLGSYNVFRKRLLGKVTWNSVVRLGEHGFESSAAAGAFTALVTLTGCPTTGPHALACLDASAPTSPAEKATLLKINGMTPVSQQAQLNNPDARIVLEERSSDVTSMLSTFAKSSHGLGTFDSERFNQYFCEELAITAGWVAEQSAPTAGAHFSGCDLILRWQEGCGDLAALMHLKETQGYSSGKWKAGTSVWGRKGVLVSLMRSMPASFYVGGAFDPNSAAVVPHDEEFLGAIYEFCRSGSLHDEVRKLHSAIYIPPHTFLKVPFDIAHWQKVAAEKYPHGLPKPFSSDPTQWLFNGHPKDSDQPLHVAMTRLLGYQWPRQTGSSFPDCPALGPDGLEKQADPDGVVPLTPLRGEPPAAERLLALLADAYGPEWSAAKLAGLLTVVGFEGKSLDDWLRDGFFSQHCDLFHQRPFVWHVWDGRRDGFHAFVNYHRLAGPNGEGRRVLETLLYAYLGDWIDRQRSDQRAGVEGADGRLVAAEHLKGELEKILAGEPPFDIFIRWKPLHEQPIGWEPDINDGVRLNIRPFMTARPLNARSRGACILRTTPRIKWDKDRGKEPIRPREDYPWFWNCDGSSTNFPGGKDFDGNRWNDLHYARTIKEATRAKHGEQK